MTRLGSLDSHEGLATMMLQRPAILLMLIVSVGITSAGVNTKSASAAEPFSYLAPGFTQSLYGTGLPFTGGVAFAPDGDPWVATFGYIARFDAQTTVMDHGQQVHPIIDTVPGGGLGLANHPNGKFYENRGSGLVEHDAETGLEIQTMGLPGNILGVAVDPITSEVVYVGASCNNCIYSIDPANPGGIHLFSSTAFAGNVDGIFFAPDGSKLFLAQMSGTSRVVALNRAGAIVQTVTTAHEPDGIAFHVSGLVVTNNTDGTMSSFDFNVSPVQETLFASGGFRGDLTQVGPDGCIYASQLGTRYTDGSETGDNSIVRLCPDFSPPPGVSNIALTPLTHLGTVGGTHTVTGVVTDENALPVDGLEVFFTVSGANAFQTSDVADFFGLVSFQYVGANPGQDVIYATATIDGAGAFSNTVFACWTGSASNNDANFIELGPSKAYDDLTLANSDLVSDECDGDDDNDRLTDLDEASGAGCAGHITNPFKADTDGDNYLDGAECAIGTDPTNISGRPTTAQCNVLAGSPVNTDADGDGIPASREVCFYNTEPNNANTDGDTCRDGKEVASVNTNSSVDVLDLAAIAAEAGTYTLPGSAVKVDFDATKNGSIDVLDLAFVAARAGPCP